MTLHADILQRNRTFSNAFSNQDMPTLPKLRTVVLACGDARVDPAHVLGLDLGDAVVIRNNGGRVTRAFIEELATLTFLVRKLTQDRDASFNLILMQHTHCGAEQFANPEVQQAIQSELGIDVSEHAITDHSADLLGDIKRLQEAAEIPNHLTVSALLYDVKTGEIREVAAPCTLAEMT